MTEIPIGKFAESVGATIDEAVRAIKISTFNGVIRDTRVDTGRLRGNWQLTSNSPASGEIERLDPNGDKAESDVFEGVQSDTVDYLVNNLPYAPVWEERDGMISRNVARIERNIREATR